MPNNQRPQPSDGAASLREYQMQMVDARRRMELLYEHLSGEPMPDKLKGGGNVAPPIQRREQ